MGFFGLLAAVGVFAGTFWLILGFFMQGAPQQAAAAAFALAFAVLPYAFFRVVQLYEGRNEERQHRKNVLKRLEAIEISLSGEAKRHES